MCCQEKGNGDVTDANTSLWLQKASKIHEVLEINTVKWTPEKEVRETWRCALRGHLTEGEAKKLSSTLWVRRMKITSADTYLEEGSVGITHACIKQKCTIIISESAQVWTESTQPIIHSNFLQIHDDGRKKKRSWGGESWRVGVGAAHTHTHTHTQKRFSSWANKSLCCVGDQYQLSPKIQLACY